MSKIAVAMSGGVDSSTTAAILKNQGHDIIGVTMRLWDEESKVCTNKRVCCGTKDASDAKSVSYKSGFEHHTLRYEDDFKKYVVDYFIESYRDYSPG